MPSVTVNEAFKPPRACGVKRTPTVHVAPAARDEVHVLEATEKLVGFSPSIDVRSMPEPVAPRLVTVSTKGSLEAPSPTSPKFAIIGVIISATPLGAASTTPESCSLLGPGQPMASTAIIESQPYVFEPLSILCPCAMSAHDGPKRQGSMIVGSLGNGVVRVGRRPPGPERRAL